MRLGDVQRHLLSRRGAVEVRPFDPDLPVFKVGRRRFATTIPSRTPPWLVVEYDPFHSELLRETHAAVRLGYPMNKRHWITVISPSRASAGPLPFVRVGGKIGPR